MFLHTAHISILDARWHRRWNRLTINGTRERISGGEMKQFCSPPSRHNPRLDLALPTSRSPWGQLACPASRDIPIRDRLRNLRQSCNLIDKNIVEQVDKLRCPRNGNPPATVLAYVCTCVCVCVRAYICASVPERNPLGAPSQKGGGESRCESVATLLRDPYSIAQLLTVLGMHVLNLILGQALQGFKISSAE